MWSKLKLILWKNLIIRKRHWFLTLIEICIPVLLFTLWAYEKSKVSGMNKTHIDEPTFHHINTEEDIYSHLDVGELNLFYSPKTDFTESIIKRVQQKLQIRGDAVKVFSSKLDILKHFGKNSSALAAIIIFKTNDSHRFDYDLTIHDEYFSWDTGKLFIPFLSTEEAGSSKYVYKGYAALQVALDKAYIELQLGNSIENLDFSMQEFPDPPRVVDSSLNQLLMYFLPLITMFSFMFLCPAVLQRVGEEKFSGIKEYMKMVGLKSWMIWLGWFIHALTTNLFSIIAIVILMKVPFWGVAYPPIKYADGTVLFFFLFLYCMAAITFCFFIASIFNTPSIAMVVGILAWLFSYFLPQTFVNSNENLGWIRKIPFALFPNMALPYGYSSISTYETREIGIQWSNLFKPGSGDGNDVTMGNVFLMLIIDMCTFMLLTLYIENVRPGKYGIAKGYNFPFVNLAKFGQKLIRKCFEHRVENAPESESLKNTDVEKGKIPCIRILNLHKKYYNHVALENLNMDIYKNSITVLLGQNGAGKTTTMSIVTGMINATSGSVIVNGKNIKKHTDEVRKSIGLCPQHNLLFPDLTVMEHLRFFAMLRGLSNVIETAKDMLIKLGLENKENDLPVVLSGGMKRRLCLGMALIGNPEVLILDEPSSGMDPESRRKVWNLLLECKKSQTIIITTHFMEEADVLGEWIAIMANGRLQCYGTPSYLKSKYNTGYHLSLLLKSKEKITKITELFRKHFNDSKLIRENDDSVVYLLPILKNHKFRYRDLIAELEQKQTDLCILSINMNETTLNDVFLKARDEVDGNLMEKNEVDYLQKNDFTTSLSSMGVQRFMNNISGLIVKRWYFLKRKYFWFIPAIVISICIFLLAIWSALSNNDSYEGSGPSVNYSLQLYGKPRIYFGGQESSNKIIIKMKIFYKDAVSRENGYPVLKEDVSTGIISTGVENIAFYKRHLIVAAEFNYSETTINVNSMFSAEALHSVPISINLAMNAIAKALLNESFSIKISNTPLTVISSQSTPTELSSINVTSVWLILLPLSIFFLMSNFIIFPNSEVSTGFIQIQTIAGIKTYWYWLTNILFDFIFSIIPLLMFACFMYIFNFLVYNSKAFEGKDIWSLFVIFILYVFASLPFTYLLSYRETITGGFTLLLMFGIFVGVIPTLIIMAMEYSQDNVYKKIAECLKYILIVISPQFTLSYISVKFSKKYVENFNWKYMDPNKRAYVCQFYPNPCCRDDYSTECSNYLNYFKNNNLQIGNDLCTMFAAFIFYFIILNFLNTQLFKKLLHFLKYFSSYFVSSEDKRDFKSLDVDYEDNVSENNKTLRVKNLTKTFGRKAIVKNLNFYLRKNKCFGLLGVNGAGKTTTFRMLTKYLFYDKGEIEIMEQEEAPISINQAKYCEKIGYCPQEDSFNNFLTGRELLRSIACMKGYVGPEADRVTDFLLNSFDLQKYADKPCLEYSGGNKRKLSTCLAFLGSPQVILLDEPTSGVDPVSRRKFWNILSSFKNVKGTSFLLCSHSMEECENLCDEIAIMKDGEIKDQGTLLALKNKYEKGFKVTIKLSTNVANAEEMELMKNEIAQRLDAELAEEYLEVLTYQIKESGKRLSELFSELEDLKDKYKVIEDYVINQISLEDIFLAVAENE